MNWFELAAKVIETGEIAGSASAVVMPTLSCQLVKFKAQQDNSGDVFIGITSGVTLAAGTTDTTTGWQLDSSEETPWLPCKNMNEFWRIADNAGDDLTYVALG